MERARSSLDQAPSHPPNSLPAWLLTLAAISLCLRWATGQTMQFLCSLPQAWRARSLPVLTILMAWPLTRRGIYSYRETFRVLGGLFWVLSPEDSWVFFGPGLHVRDN